MIKGTVRPLRPSAQKKLDFRASIHNRFDVEVIDAATGEIKQRARGYNIICSTLWQRLFAYNAQNHWTPQGYFNYVLYGGGSGTPAAADTELFDLIGYKSASQNRTMTRNVGSGVIYRQAVVTLEAEDAVGETLTEVGIGYDQTHIVTHAMLEDMNGNPISIDKTDTDVIKIYATIYVHFPAGGWHSSSVTVAEVSSIDEYSLFGILTGYANNPTYVSFVRFGAGTRTGTATGYSRVTSRTDIDVIGGNQIECKNRIAAAELNLPIRSILVGFSPYAGGATRDSDFFWLTPGPWASYSDVDGEPVGTGDGASVGFATAFPVSDGYAVYVNGVEAENVTFRPGPADAAHMENWFNACYRNADGTANYYTSNYSISTRSGITYLACFDTAVGYVSAALENPFSAIGIAKIRGLGLHSLASANTVARIEVSNDMLTWESAGTFELSRSSSSPAELTIPQALRTRKYWRFINVGPYVADFHLQFVADVADTAHNIVFSSPPAAGAVITADYEPDCIPKDINHVFDIDLVITVGEYQEV